MAVVHLVKLKKLLHGRSLCRASSTNLLEKRPGSQIALLLVECLTNFHVIYFIQSKMYTERLMCYSIGGESDETSR